MKTCFKCGVEQPVCNFYDHPKMAEGKLNKCKMCTKRDVSRNYQLNREKYQEYERKRFQNSIRKQNTAIYQKRHRTGNNLKYKARTAVGNALRDGRLVKQTCEICGSIETQAHHTDYSKPLDVRWLCFQHHREDHGQMMSVRF